VLPLLLLLLSWWRAWCSNSNHLIVRIHQFLIRAAAAAAAAATFVCVGC
jgi:hypothetical protein